MNQTIPRRWQNLVSTASRFFGGLQQVLFGPRLPPPLPEEVMPAPVMPARPVTYRRLERVILTDEVSRTIFEEYTQHRQTDRGNEETGWMLLGVREETEALVLATLPAGLQSSSSTTHILMNSKAHGIATRIVRHWDKRLVMLGVLHTHPGSLRHPSRGDYHGDSQWVGRLRGREGIFGIGTADGEVEPGPAVMYQPEEHMQCLGELSLSWYALAEGDANYRRLPVNLTLGPDLARGLHSIWPMLETHAEALERLCKQQAGVTFAMLSPPQGPALAVTLPLLHDDRLRLVLSAETVKYYLMRSEDLIEVDPHEPRLDRGVYLILAELAGQD